MPSFYLEQSTALQALRVSQLQLDLTDSDLGKAAVALARAVRAGQAG